MTAHCIYLHGFASGPASTKCLYFSRRLQECGLSISAPDLNQPDFSRMTLTSQLKHVDAELKKANDRNVILIGSSMGGLLSTMRAGVDQVRALVLLAPGFGLNRRWNELLGEEKLSTWKETGSILVFHYGADKELPLQYSFIEDARQYRSDGFKVSIPTLVFHGSRDETVPIEESHCFAMANAEHVELVELDDDHHLTVSLPQMWLRTFNFLQSWNLIGEISPKKKSPE